MENRSNQTGSLSIIFAIIVALLTPAFSAEASQTPRDLPKMGEAACTGALSHNDLVSVPIVRSCDRDGNGVNDCIGKNPYQCSLHCKGLSGIDLDFNMRMLIAQGDGTCVRENLQGALLWKGAVAPGNDRPGDAYTDPRRSLPSGVLLFGALQDREILVATKIDYCDSALGDLQRCSEDRNTVVQAFENDCTVSGGNWNANERSCKRSGEATQGTPPARTATSTSGQRGSATTAKNHAFYDKYNAAYASCAAKGGQFLINQDGTHSCFLAASQSSATLSFDGGNWPRAMVFVLAWTLLLELGLALLHWFILPPGRRLLARVRQMTGASAPLQAIRDLLKIPADADLLEAIQMLRTILRAPPNADLCVKATQRMQERRSARDAVVAVARKLGLDVEAAHTLDLAASTENLVDERDGLVQSVHELSHATPSVEDHSNCISRDDHVATLDAERAARQDARVAHERELTAARQAMHEASQQLAEARGAPADHSACVTQAEFAALQVLVSGHDAIEAVLQELRESAPDFRLLLAAPGPKNIKVAAFRAAQARVRALFTAASIPEQAPPQA